MLKLFLADVKMMFRNKQALFWSVMFPLMFTFIFGMFFGKDNQGGGTIALINKSDTELAQNVEKAIKDSNFFKISDEKDLEKAEDLVKKNQISSLLLIPEKFGSPIPDSPRTVKVTYDPANSASVSLLEGILNGVLTQVNYEIQNAKPIYHIEEEKTNTRKLNYFDFILMGLLGMALMNSSIQGVSIALAKYKEDKILKRITTTPLPVWQFVFGEIASRLILNFIQVSLILAVGTYLFDAHIYGNIFLVYLLALIGALLFQAIGFAIAAVSKTTQAAEGMATAVSIPMMFLAGVFFPVDQLPKWLYSIVQYLPLAPLLRMIRGIALEEISPFSNPLNIEIVAGWIIAMLALTIWRFKMSEE